MRDVALVTSSEFPGLSPDDRFLLTALLERGLDAVPAVWDDSSLDWSSFKVCVVRSSWDYHRRLPEFLAWVDRVSVLTRLWNPKETIRWNTHKLYLRDLETRGVPIVPTVWLESGTHATFLDVMQAEGWQQAVIKPTVSASAHETILVSRSEASRGQEHIERLLPEMDLMVQPYLASVSEYGERSVMFVGGEFTHSVRRPAVLEDPHVEHNYPGMTPSDEEMELGWQALRASARDYLYARVDIVRDDSNRAVLMELELVEPSLFFAQAPWAAERMADAIVRLCRDDRR